MSKDNVKLMFGKIQKDQALQKKYAEFIKSHSASIENTLLECLTKFGKTEGFVFSKDDLLAARADLIDGNNSNAELDDAELDKVAGGGQHKTEAVLASVATLGVVCAISSVVSDAISRGTCATALTASAGCDKY